MNFDICDMSGLEKYYIDGVHLNHDGNIELAERFSDSILSMGKNK